MALTFGKPRNVGKKAIFGKTLKNTRCGHVTAQSRAERGGQYADINQRFDRNDIEMGQSGRKGYRVVVVDQPERTIVRVARGHVVETNVRSVTARKADHRTSGHQYERSVDERSEPNRPKSAFRYGRSWIAKIAAHAGTGKDGGDGRKEDGKHLEKGLMCVPFGPKIAGRHVPMPALEAFALEFNGRRDDDTDEIVHNANAEYQKEESLRLLGKRKISKDLK